MLKIKIETNNLAFEDDRRKEIAKCIKWLKNIQYQGRSKDTFQLIKGVHEIIKLLQKGGEKMTKQEQLKGVFTKEIKKLMGDHENALVDNLIVPIQSVVNDTVNTLLKEVTIRFNLENEKECKGYDGLTGWRDEG